MLLILKYTKTDLIFGFTRPRQNACRAGERLTGRKPNLGEGIPGQKTPRTLLAQFYLGFYLYACVPYAQAVPKTTMR